MKNLYSYLMAMVVLLSVIVTTNVLAMEKTKQDDLRHQFEDTIMEIKNLLFYGVLVDVMREFAVTIFNLFIPIMFLLIGAGLAWNWWLSSHVSSSTMNGIKNSPAPNSPAAVPPYHHNLREKRQKHFI